MNKPTVAAAARQLTAWADRSTDVYTVQTTGDRLTWAAGARTLARKGARWTADGSLVELATGTRAMVVTDDTVTVTYPWGDQTQVVTYTTDPAVAVCAVYAVGTDAVRVALAAGEHDGMYPGAAAAVAGHA